MDVNESNEEFAEQDVKKPSARLVPSYWSELGDLSEDTVISEGNLADMLGKHRVSIKRAVKRGELPPPTRLMGKPVWTVSAIRKHLNGRLDDAKREYEQLDARLAKLNP